MKTLLSLIMLIGLVLVAGCTQTNQQLSGQDSASLEDATEVFDDFESTLLDESNDIELGSII